MINLLKKNNSIFALICLFCVLSGCESLPESETANSTNLPTSTELNLLTTRPGDLVYFRPLKQFDFRTAPEPKSLTIDNVQLGLHANFAVLVSPHATLGFRPVKKEKLFELRAKDVFYVAVFDRRSAWLSPTLQGSQIEYVLDHVNVHFMLYEIAARRLTQTAQKLIKKGYKAKQPDTLVAQFTSDMARHIAYELEQVNQQVQAFDQSTATQLNSALQADWSRRMQQTLQEKKLPSYAAYLKKRYPDAHSQAIEALRFSDAGIYQTGPCEGIVLKLQSLGHMGCVTRQSPLFMQSTQQVPLRKGLTFGLQFSPQGLAKNQWIELEVLTVYPKPGVTPPSITPSDKAQTYRSNLAQILVSGDKAKAPHLYLYELAEDWELVPGQWRFEFYSQGRKIAEHAFELIPDS